MNRIFSAAFASCVAFATSGAALAGEPRPWQLGMQDPAGPIAKEIYDLHNLLLVITVLIASFVLGLLLYIMVRFKASANPVPSKTTHNTFLEIVWTAVPILILVVIAIPSFKLLHFQAFAPKVDLTVKATGYQWYWGYEYPDQGISFDATLTAKEDVKNKAQWLMDTENHLVIPAGKNIRLITTSADVIHAWAVFSLGVNINATPGRINEVWFKIDKPGTYFGHCNKICGTNHAFMPIAIDALGEREFEAWLVEAKKKFATTGETGRQYAELVSAAR